MIFRQILHDDLGCASYLVGDEKAGVAAVVDPRFEIDAYLDIARYLGVRITDVFETHNHADHVSGHGRLVAATGARIHVHALVEPEFEHEPFEHGDQWDIGGVRIKALHTPGHRPEHTAFLLADTRRGDDPWAVLTGDSLFVGDVARPDLAVEKAEGARGIFNSLHGQLLPLPDYIEVWPGHLGGSMCGGPGMDMKVGSTIGFERRHNDLLKVTDESEFVERSIANLGAQPPNFRAIVDLNHGPLLTEASEPVRLTPGRLAAEQQAGAVVIDVRSDVQFSAAHVPNALSIPMHKAGFGTKLAWLAAGAPRILFVGSNDADGIQAAHLAAAVGLGRDVGYLGGGFAAWGEEEGPVAKLERLPVGAFAERLAAEPNTQIIDVRTQEDWDAGHIPASVLIPWQQITEIPAGIDPDEPIAVICASGQRAGIAASVLQAHGASRVLQVAEGGVPQWGALGGPLLSAESELPTAV
jgi:hydroxyacylglutathione hydrolase